MVNHDHEDGYHDEDAEEDDEDDDGDEDSDEESAGRKKHKSRDHPPRLNEDSIQSVTNYAQVYSIVMIIMMTTFIMIMMMVMMTLTMIGISMVMMSIIHIDSPFLDFDFSLP